MPPDITYNTDSGLATAVVTWSKPEPTDTSGTVTLTSSRSPGSSFDVGTANVTYTAIDEAGNTVSATFTVTIEGMV